MTTTKSQKNAAAVAAFRGRQEEKGRAELRGIMATPDEQVILKKICRDKLKELRSQSCIE